MPRTSRVVVLVALATLALAPAGRGQVAAPARHVVVLSLDGARADALRAAMPAALAARGAISWTAKTTLPSLTLPAHASMLAGVPPRVHGVLVNDWQVGQPSFERATVFTEVTRAGRRAVALVAKAKLLMLTPPGSVAVARHLVYPRYRQADVVASAAAVVAEQRPALVFVHVADPDDAGHRAGWMSPAYLQVVAGIPALIERLLRALDDAGAGETGLLLVTADHGGHGRTHGTDRPEDVTIPWLAFGGAARGGVTIAREVVTYDTAATVLAALGLPIPADWHGRPVREALAR
ncbi:MAG: alkaline phosphatase family protein [Armatimonadota bacterium]|nr:alkaline phosphatase family protein [Armatimonadota bacterium]